MKLAEGCNSSIEIAGETVVKTSHLVFPTAAQAEQYGAELELYASQLADEPLQVAALRSVAALPDGDGFRVRHAYDMVAGDNLEELTGQERTRAAATVIAQIAGMRTLGSPDTLLVPVDAKAGNFHLGPDGSVVLVDITPPLSRDADGQFPGRHFPGDDPNMIGWRMGTKSGAITYFLKSLVQSGDSASEKLASVVRMDASWCRSLLPDDLHPDVRKAVERQIRLHFAPLIGRIALSRVSTKFSRGE